MQAERLLRLVQGHSADRPAGARHMQQGTGEAATTAESNGERPAKRVRLSVDDEPTITTRRMQDLETSLEVDHMILDYLIYQAINVCFQHPHHATDSQEPSPVEQCLGQVDAFWRLFEHTYPRYKLDEELRFRQQLLQLVSLITQRMVKNASTPSRQSLKRLRADNQTRARTWIGDASRLPSAHYNADAFDLNLPLPEEELEENRQAALAASDVRAEDEAYEDLFYGTSASISLLDLLPSFMRVSSACQKLFDKQANESWMQLAAELMLQSCLEQYLFFGASGSDAIDEAFAWGFRTDSQRGVDQSEVADEDPFGYVDADDQDLASDWEDIRREALASLFPSKNEDGSQPDIPAHLGILTAKYPRFQTEQTVRSFLRGISTAISSPVLTQLQDGQLEGMSKGETKALIRECGIDLDSLIT